jgi:hypothetical protein
MKNLFSLNNIIKILLIALLAIPLIFFTSMVAFFAYSKLSNKPYVNAYTPVFSGGPTDAYSASTATATQFDPVTASPVESGGVQSTYLPGVRRPVRAYNGPLDANGVVPMTTPSWWLYAYSAEEAAWLDKHGYPTPAEDQRLRSSSLQELQQLMDLGDRNARTFIAARIAENNFYGTPEKYKGYFVSMGSGDLQIATPYQAIVTAETYLDLRKAYYEKFPTQRTEKELQTLRSLATSAEEAWQIARIQGDTVIDAISNARKESEFGLIRDNGDTDPALRADVFISTIYNMQRLRPQVGMPPLDFEQRPSPLLLLHRGKPAQVLERY